MTPHTLHCTTLHYKHSFLIVLFLGNPTNVSNLQRVNKQNKRKQEKETSPGTSNKCQEDASNEHNNNNNSDDEYEFVWRDWKLSYLNELRWVVLGYHFQWTERKY